MFEQHKTFTQKYRLFIFTFVLVFLNVFLFHLDWQNSHRGFTFAMLDVGKGDGLFIESPSGTKIMFDAGPPRSVLGPLARTMSPDRKSVV